MRQIAKQPNFLDFVPHRASAFTLREDGAVVLTLTHTGLFDRLAQRCFGRPAESEIALDALGSFVWMQIDGCRTVHALGPLVQAQFGESAEPLYERLSVFLGQLRRYGFLTLE